jgi:peptidoglycan/xylan/chitin deacetylase (PgdA/CDA1 family)
LGGKVRSIRQHHLQYDPSKTPKAQQGAGFEFDSSVAVAGDNGFRCGTSYPWEPVRQRDEAPYLLEIPHIVSEGPWLKTHRQDLTHSIAIQRTKEIIDRVRAVGGVFTLNWHASRIKNEHDIEMYEHILKYVAESGGWFGTVSEVGDRWNKNNSNMSRRFDISHS